jgi:hypothetical protein
MSVARGRSRKERRVAERPVELRHGTAMHRRARRGGLNC